MVLIFHDIQKGLTSGKVADEQRGVAFAFAFRNLILARDDSVSMEVRS